MDAANRKEKANELLTNWSKWLITINIFAATGCIVGLKTAGQATEKLGLYFFIAIVSFSLSILCATLFVFVLAKQGVGNKDKDTSAFIWLAKLQWILFTLGLIFVLVWIGLLAKVF